MSVDQDIFADTDFGKIALKRMAEQSPLPEGFRLFSAGWMEDHPEKFWNFKVIGAQFRMAKTGKNKGKPTIKVEGTERVSVITKRELMEVANGK